MITLESTTSEKLGVVVTTTADPTGTPPSFAVSTGADPGTFSAGTWTSTWDASTGEVSALTPTVGAAATLVVAQGNDYRLYCRWAVGTEQPTRIAAIVRVV